MKYSILLIAFLLIQITLKAQGDSTFFASYLVLMENNFMKVENASGLLIYQKQFYRPYVYDADIDADQFDELIIVDSVITNSKLEFVIYFYGGEEDFFLIDSIYSGSFFPFITYSEEIKSIIIETGIVDFEIYNEASDVTSLPINIFKLENDRLISVNDEVYEPFLFENANLIQLLDYHTADKILDCSTSQLYKGIIVSAYVNYINGGEQSLAAQMLKKYYLCDDIEDFKKEIMELLFPKAK